MVSKREIKLINTVYYFYENDELIYRCTKNVYYNVYLDDESWGLFINNYSI